jgi:hypothetical protein
VPHVRNSVAEVEGMWYVDFAHAHDVLGEEDLAVEVGGLDVVHVHQDQLPHPQPAQAHRHAVAQPAAAQHQRRRLLHLFINLLISKNNK